MQETSRRALTAKHGVRCRRAMASSLLLAGTALVTAALCLGPLPARAAPPTSSGSNGANTSSKNGQAGNGGAASNLAYTNTTTIDQTCSSGQNTQILEVFSVGGNGGSGGSVSLTNQAPVTFTTGSAAVTNGARLVVGVSGGGAAGQGVAGAHGGNASSVSVTNSAPVSLAWN